ncbi:MAG: hypothetical protein QNJ97_09740 [Myxococcota bacterium]|nr:hypothetical protein [Myxococcota bacterium]
MTDEIEFVEARNHPPTMLRFDPADPIQTVKNEAGKAYFTVLIWDPDETDLSQINAQIIVRRESDPANATIEPERCTAPVASEPLSVEGIDPKYLASGTLALVTCDETYFNIVGTTPVDAYIALRLEISDLGYVGFEPKEDAFTTSVTWFFRVME